MLKKLLQNRHFRFGLPFMIVVVGGSFGLQVYSQIRYDVQKHKKITTKTKEIQALTANKKPVTLEEAYSEYKETVDLDSWKNVRGPRPWEEGQQNESYKDLIEKRAEDSKKGWIFK